MIKYFCMLLIVVLPLGCCGLFKKPIVIDSVIDEKVRMDETENPAMKLIIKEDLGKKRIELYDVVVKDVTESTNIDYDFCIIADVQTKKGPVQCHIYTTDVKTMSRLVKGQTKIDVKGIFGRFFSLLDDYYTRIEIINSCVTIK